MSPLHTSYCCLLVLAFVAGCSHNPEKEFASFISKAASKLKAEEALQKAFTFSEPHDIVTGITAIVRIDYTSKATAKEFGVNEDEYLMTCQMNYEFQNGRWKLRETSWVATAEGLKLANQWRARAEVGLDNPNDNLGDLYGAVHSLYVIESKEPKYRPAKLEELFDPQR